MLAIEFRFCAGRYHATPWDHHVNEGIVEWPPSPWRILRALIAVWHRKAIGDVDESTLVSLIGKLTESVPSYSVPPAVASHTRHYVPLYKEKTTKIFDTFVDVRGDEPLVAIWPELIVDQADRAPLGILLERLGYLGRAESWVKARMIDSPPPANTYAVGERVRQEPGDGTAGERIRLLGPLPAADYGRWRGAVVDEHVTRKLMEKKRKAEAKGKASDRVTVTKREREVIEASLPQSVFAALEVRTAELRKAGWSQAPGSQWIDYVRPGIASASRASARRRRPERQAPTMARFALAGNVLPRFTNLVSVADRVRTALMSRGNGAPVFSGRDADRTRLLRGHRHAFVLPEANGNHGRVTHVTLFAEMKFDDHSRRALDGLSRVWGRGGHDIQLVLIGVGSSEDFAGANLGAGQCALVASATIWESRTPFVPTRHPKWFRDGRPKLDEQGLQIGSPEHDLRRLLTEAGLPQPVRIESVSGTLIGGKRVRWIEFHTDRKKGGGRRAARVGTGFRLHFSTLVRGPITLGYGAHFGLGGFAPAGFY